MTPGEFKHKITVAVRFNEVDMLGVCNNAVFINYFEHARLQYIKKADLFDGKSIFSGGKLFFVVRNEINYFDHARYDDQLNIYTRISYIKNSSFGFEHLVELAGSNKIIADGKGVIVQVDPATRKSAPFNKNFYDKIIRFEGNVQILKNDS